MNARVYRADTLLALTALIWGVAFVAQRAGMGHIGPLTFNGIRFALGAMALLPLALRTQANLHAAGQANDAARGRLGGSRLELLGMLLAGVVLFGGASLQQLGLVYTTAGKAGFVTGLYVVMVPIMGLAWGQKTTLGVWMGAGLSAVGLYFLSVTEEFTVAYGDLLELLGAVVWAGHVHVIGWLSPRMSPVRLACGQFAVCAVLSLAAGLYSEPFTVQGMMGAAVPLLYGGFVSVGVAYTLQVVAQKDAPPAHASIILSQEALFAALAGWLLLDEALSGRAMLGCALMMTGFLAAQLWPARLRPAASSDA